MGSDGDRPDVKSDGAVRGAPCPECPPTRRPLLACRPPGYAGWRDPGGGLGRGRSERWHFRPAGGVF